jgi:aminopeptidase S
VGISVLLAVVSCGTGAAQSPPTAADGLLVRQLTGAVTDAGALAHLQALQKIADEHGGNRAARTPGYEASVEYVVGVLRGGGFEVSSPTYELSGDDDEVAPGTGRNVIGQTRSGDPGPVVMIGAHLDSVPDGPGIVDNGSGVASLLEIATRLGAEPAVQNQVRFASFGHEETGAQGSTGYVENLSADDREKIKLYVNVDMVASPNAGYFVQGGTGGDPQTAGPAGSAAIGQVLPDQLARRG